MGSRAHVKRWPQGDSQIFHPQGQGEGAGLSRRESGACGSSLIFLLLFSVKKQQGHGLRAREKDPGGLQREEKWTCSQVEGEQVDQRNVAGLLNGTLEDCIFQDGSNIFHPTSSSGTFCSPTKN